MSRENHSGLSKSEYPYLNIFPQYRVSAIADNPEVDVFAGKCFEEIRTSAIAKDDGTGYTVNIEASKPKSLTCEDNVSATTFTYTSSSRPTHFNINIFS